MLKIKYLPLIVLALTFTAISTVNELAPPIVFAIEKKVTIVEGMTVKEISNLLISNGILQKELPANSEGYLFPDTYNFFAPSSRELVLEKFVGNLNAKVGPIIPPGGNIKDILTVASLIEKEVPNSSDRRIVSGIIWKKLKNGSALYIDYSICYVLPKPCHPITKDNLQIKSPYNTYLNLGLPPTPIGNPGLDAINAALHPQLSDYWYYLTDPETGRAVFSRDLDEHNKQVYTYLKSNN